MNNHDQQQKLAVYLQEYSKLKDEQVQRIGFRDNLLYVTLGVLGAILSFALSQESSDTTGEIVRDAANNTNYYALLVIPWVCLILGWAYLVNDQKISALAKYFRTDLREKINQELGIVETDKTSRSTFGWETKNIEDGGRKWRKIEQLIINEIAFVISGIVALVYFWVHFFSFRLPSEEVQALPLMPMVYALSVIELTLLLILGVEIFRYAELKMDENKNKTQD